MESKPIISDTDKIIVEIKPEIFLNESKNSTLVTQELSKIEHEQMTHSTVTKPIEETLSESELISKALLNASESMMASSLEYFKHPSQPAQILEDEEVYSRISSMKHLVKNKNFNEYDLFIRHQCVDSFKNLLQHSYYELVDVDFDMVDIDLENKVVEKLENLNMNQKKFGIFYNLLVIINEIIFRSIEVNIYLGNIEIVRSMVAFLNEDFIRKCDKKKCVILLLIKNLSLLSRWSDDCKLQWKDMNVVETLLNTTKIIHEHNSKVDEDDKETKEIVLNSYYAIGNIADDKQIEALPEIPQIINMLLDELVLVDSLFSKNRLIEKEKLPFMNADKSIEYLKTSYLNRITSPNLIGLTRFAVNETTKKTIFRNFKSIRVIVFKGYTIEKILALRLLAQLCFNDEIAEEVLLDTDLCNYLQDQIQQNRNKDLKRVAQIILWSINKDSKDPNKNKHVFISYSPSTRETCEKIKVELEKKGIQVWMDGFKNGGINLGAGTNIERSSRAIDRSRCVLICICEKFRISEKCQAEALYSLRLRKPIVPVILQEGFENVDGWLSIIMKDRVAINFSINDFNDSIIELIEQINTPTLVLGKNIDAWTQSHVAQWFAQTEIHSEIAKVYQDLDGQTLKQIYMLKNQSPEFFYQSLTKETNYKITTSDIAFFNCKLESLFKD